jgi:hypothetical protein
MEEIKVGEYIRNNDGGIGKITKVINETIFYVQYYDNIPFKTDIYETKIKSHSKDIKNLIEPRDFVNEMIVDKDCNGLICTDINGDFHYLDKIQIKTILTHEMYEQNCYKVGED